MTSTPTSLADVLRQATDTKGKIKDLSVRAAGCIAQAEGTTPDFDFNEVNAERKAEIERLVYLNTVLARNNAVTTIEWKGRRIIVAEAIRRKAELSGEIKFLEGLTLRSGPTKVPTGEYNERHQPVYEAQVWKSAITEPARVKQVAVLKADCSALDRAIQTSNHVTVVDLEDPAT